MTGSPQPASRPVSCRFCRYWNTSGGDRLTAAVGECMSSRSDQSMQFSSATAQCRHWQCIHTRPTRQRVCAGCGKVETVYKPMPCRFCLDCSRQGLDPSRPLKLFQPVRRLPIHKDIL